MIGSTAPFFSAVSAACRADAESLAEATAAVELQVVCLPAHLLPAGLLKTWLRYAVP